MEYGDYLQQENQENLLMGKASNWHMAPKHRGLLKGAANLGGSGKVGLQWASKKITIIKIPTGSIPLKASKTEQRQFALDELKDWFRK